MSGILDKFKKIWHHAQNSTQKISINQNIRTDILKLLEKREYNLIYRQMKFCNSGNKTKNWQIANKAQRI